MDFAVLLRTESGQRELVSCLAKAFSYDELVWKEDPSFILDNQEKEYND